MYMLSVEEIGRINTSADPLVRSTGPLFCVFVGEGGGRIQPERRNHSSASRHHPHRVLLPPNHPPLPNRRYNIMLLFGEKLPVT